MSADLRELLEATAPRPTAPVDPASIRGRSRRRRRGRRLGGGAGALVAALAVAVAWPGALPGDLVIDEVADTPDDGDDAAVPALDLPGGWQQVRVGDAVFGVPDELEIVELTEDDQPPCTNTGPRAYLARDAYPSHVPETAPEGATSDGALVCNAAHVPAPVLFAVPLSVVPDDRFQDSSGRQAWEPTVVGSSDLPGERLVLRGFGEADRHARYRFASVDLFLEATTTYDDADLVDAILATVTPIGAPAEALPDGPSSDPGVASDVAPDQLPEGVWEHESYLGDVTFPVPSTGGVLPTISVGPSGAIGSARGCNQIRAATRISDERLWLYSSLHTLGVGCADDGDRFANEVLTEGPTVRIDGDRLTLTRPDGAGIVYRRVDREPGPLGPISGEATGFEGMVGGAVVRLPEGGRVVTGQDQPVPCPRPEDGPLLVVLDRLAPSSLGSCLGSATSAVVVVTPLASTDPAIAGDGPGDEVDVGGATALRRGSTGPDGVALVTYAAPELDLHVLVVDPDRDPGFVDEVLATVTAAPG